MRDIHVSIVSHGHARYLERLLGELAALPSAARLQLTLVVNLADETLNLAPAGGLPVRLIQNAEPQGFAHNHNMAFEAAPLPDERIWFVVLNPDVALRGDVLAILAHALSEDPSAGVAAPLVLAPDGTRADSARELPTPARLVGKLFGRSGVWPAPATARNCAPDWVAGMCMMFPERAFAQVGGFDRRYYLYYEDVDICSRLWLAGYRVLVVTAGTIVHEAQRASRRDWAHARWHLDSIGRFLRSDVYRRARALHRERDCR